MNRILEYILNSNGVTFAQIIKKFNLKKSEKAYLDSILRGFEKDGKITFSRGKYYKASGLIRGTVCATNSGIDFFVSDELEEDLKISGSLHLCLMNNDEVLATRHGGKAIVNRIIQRANTDIVGEVVQMGDLRYLVCDDPKIHFNFILPKSENQKAKTGDKVAARITAYPQKNSDGICKIIKNMGQSGNVETQIAATLFSYGVAENFDFEVIRESNELPNTVKDFDGRLDLRKLNCITIDGDDARDFDDAVSLEMTEKGDYLLGVHIADVSHYVTAGSALDNEASRRATSVYIPGKVFPMLPEKLSNGICSLNEGVDRFTLSCFMIINNQGTVKEYSIQPAVICSKHRMTYNAVNRMLEDKDRELIKKYDDIYGMLLLMKKLADILGNNAIKRGYIDFDLPEPKVILDENGYCKDIVRYYVGTSNKIIEEFMLIANMTVAKFMRENSIPAIYRVHDAPETRKAQMFCALTKKFGYNFNMESTPKQYQEFLHAVKDKPEGDLLQKVMLRSMSKAKYRTTCDGHFGLATDNYLHFTSPIRRYPDLCVHRMIHYHIEKQYKNADKFAQKLNDLANVSTSQEVNATACERDIVDIRCAQYMTKHIGEEFDAIVSGVTSNGMFAALDNTVEGFIPIRTMGNYQYIEEEFALVGYERTYSLGDKIRIKVMGAYPCEGKVDFLLAKNKE